jgi:NIF3 (NGG1p interacting factor 3)
VTTLSRRAFVRAASTPLVIGIGGQATPTSDGLTAQQLVDRIRARLGVEWREKTTDGFKAGDPSTTVTGIAVTSVARQDVLRRAVAARLNLVITQEPTFYSASDEPGNRAADPVYLTKKGSIEQHRLVIWRFSDHWSRREPDPRVVALAEALGWGSRAVAGKPGIYAVPETRVDAVIGLLEKRLAIRGGLRLTGPRDLRVRNVLLSPGTADLAATVQRMPDADLLIAGEPREWEVVPYLLDTAEAGRPTAMIAVGRLVSEEPGTRACAEWLRSIVRGVRVESFATGDPYWTARP